MTDVEPTRSISRPEDRQSKTMGRYRETVVLLAHAQKTSKGAPAYSRFVNRPAGRRLAAVAFLLGRTPNEVTAVSAVFSGIGIVLIATVHPALWVGLAISLCLVIGYAFDAADGQLARLRGGGSASGEWLDHVIDATKISSLHLAVLIASYRFFDLGSAAWLLIPIGFTVVAAVMFFAMILNDQLRRQQAVVSGKAVDRGNSSTLRSLAVIPTDYGVMCLVFPLLAIPTVFFGAYTFLFLCNAGFLALAAVKWFRDMQVLSVTGTRR